MLGVVVFDEQSCSFWVHRAIDRIHDFAADKYFLALHAVDFCFNFLRRVERYEFFVIYVQIRCYGNSFCLENSAAKAAID